MPSRFAEAEVHRESGWLESREAIRLVMLELAEQRPARQPSTFSCVGLLGSLVAMGRHQREKLVDSAS